MLTKSPKVPFLKVDPAWNALGPPVPLWFKEQLKQVDKDIVLQFIPPISRTNPRGCNPKIHPNGVWDICKKMGDSHYLHPRCVYSLTDMEGNHCQPTPKTYKLIRTAWAYHRRNQTDRLQRVMEDSLRRINSVRRSKQRDQLANALHDFACKAFSKQWQNRVRVDGKICEGITKEE